MAHAISLMTELGEAKRKHQASGKAQSRRKSNDSAGGSDKEANQDSDEAEIIEHSGTSFLSDLFLFMVL